MAASEHPHSFFFKIDFPGTLSVRVSLSSITFPLAVVTKAIHRELRIDEELLDATPNPF